MEHAVEAILFRGTSWQRMGMMSDGVCDSGDEKNRTGRGGGTAMKRNGQHQRSYGG